MAAPFFNMFWFDSFFCSLGNFSLGNFGESFSVWFANFSIHSFLVSVCLFVSLLS